MGIQGESSAITLLWLLFYSTVAGVVPCGGRKKSPRTNFDIEWNSRQCKVNDKYVLCVLCLKIKNKQKKKKKKKKKR